MWRILEHNNVVKRCHRLPQQVSKKYELWKNLVFRHGPGILKKFPGFHDEKLTGNREGQRSSRLSAQYRVIYNVNGEEATIYVIEITPHHY